MVKVSKRQKVMAMFLGIAMCFFAVIAFGGASCNTEPTVRQRMDSVGLRVDAMQNDSNATVEDTEAFLTELADLHSEIAELYGDGNATLLTRLDGYMAQLRELRAKLLRAVRQFPSPMEEFTLEYFNDEFFENYTLIFVPLYGSGMGPSVYFFYTTYIYDGKINFLVEFDFRTGHAAFWRTLFAMIIPNEILSHYEIGHAHYFTTYTIIREPFSSPVWIENCREWLNEIEGKSIEHRAGFAHGYSICSDGYYRYWLIEGYVITPITSVNELSLRWW